MTNKEYLESLPPETQLHTTLMKFYSCLTELERWNLWLGAQYSPDDPAWIHSIPMSYNVAAQGKPKGTVVKVPDSPFQEMTDGQLTEFQYQYNRRNSAMTLIGDVEVIENVKHWYIARYGPNSYHLEATLLKDYESERILRGMPPLQG